MVRKKRNKIWTAMALPAVMILGPPMLKYKTGVSWKKAFSEITKTYKKRLLR